MSSPSHHPRTEALQPSDDPKRSQADAPTLAELSRLLARTSDPAQIEAILMALLTPAEARDLSTRWELVKRLDRGDTQRHIAKELGLSLCKITRGSRELKKPGSALKQLVDRLQEMS